LTNIDRPNRAMSVAMLVVSFVLVCALPANAGVSCWTIDDPDQRALCRAQQTNSRGNCSAISDYALRKECEVRTGAPASNCNAITDQWQRQKCRDAAAKK
jgi:hypothetical protein